MDMSKKRVALKRSEVPDEGPDQMLTVDQVGAILGCGPETVRKLCRDKKLPHYRSSARIVRVKRSELDESLKATRVAAAS